MSVRSESHVGNVIVSVSERPEEVKKVPKTANEIAGYLGVLKPHEAVRKSLDPIDPKVRNKTWMSSELCVYANNEYVFATFPIALALFWDMGGKEICETRSLTVIFTILSHCLSTTATNNYSLRTLGKWSCEDTVQKGSVPLAPVDDFLENPGGSKLEGNVPKTFYSSLFALILTTLRFKEMSWGTDEGHDELKGVEYIEKELSIKNFKTVDLLSGFVLENGEGLPEDFLCMDFDLKEWLLKGKAKALTKTETCVYHDKDLDKHTSCWYNSFSKHLVGNYENWVYAQAVKDWCVGSYKTIFDTLKTLDGLNLLKDVKEGLSNEWGTVYFWFHVDLTESEKNV